MTHRENLLRVLRGEEPEWIPIVGYIDRYNQPKREGMPAEPAEKLANVRWCVRPCVRYEEGSPRRIFVRETTP